MPATQVYFKQKTFSEARELSEAIGRTTIEEATVNDNGRANNSAITATNNSESYSRTLDRTLSCVRAPAECPSMAQ